MATVGVSTQSHLFLMSEDRSGTPSRQAICEAVHTRLAEHAKQPPDAAIDRPIGT
jgi:hypothetical protein